MLQNGMIHGDLSAYNILYWEGEITLIDFPQVTDSRGNTHARDILARDVTRVCEYFADQGVDNDPQEHLVPPVETLRRTRRATSGRRYIAAARSQSNPKMKMISLVVGASVLNRPYKISSLY